MDSSNLLVICAIAFVAVFVLLVILAVIMRAIIALFPQADSIEDAAMYAAITAVAQANYPGTKITKIEEIQ